MVPPQSSISTTSPTDTEEPETPRPSTFSHEDVQVPSAVDAVTNNDEDITHPFANTKSLLVVIPNEGIDIEAEARFLDDLMIDNERYFPQSTRMSISAPSSPQEAPSLFSRDIFLEDNSGHSNVFARKVVINGWTSVGDKKGGAYVVYDCVVTTAQSTVIHTHKRYSAFVDLHLALRRTLPSYMHHNIPNLPPKSPFAKFRSSFLDKRRRQLQHWLTVVLLHPDIGGLPIVRQWIME